MKTKQTVLPYLCQFPFADGRSCRMPRSQDHNYPCVFNADRERPVGVDAWKAELRRVYSLRSRPTPPVDRPVSQRPDAGNNGGTPIS